MIDPNVLAIAQAYQKAAGKGLPFSGTTGEMVEALGQEFRADAANMQFLVDRAARLTQVRDIVLVDLEACKRRFSAPIKEDKS